MTLEKQRLHPVSILLFIFTFIKNGYREIFSFSLAYGVGLSKYVSPIWLLIPVGLFLAYGVAYWWRFTFHVANEQLILDKGVFNRNSTHIPKNKIQVINRNSTLLQQLFSLESLTIETAGSNENAKLSGIKKELAEVLQNYLKSNQTVFQETPTELSSPFLFSYQARLSDLIIHGLSSRTVGIIGVFFLYSLEYINDFVDKDSIRSTRDNLKQFDTVLLVLGLISVFLFILFTLAIGFNLVRYHRFTMNFDTKEIRLSYGFFDKKHITIPAKKVQSLRIVRNPILALFRRYRVFVEASGSHGDSGSGRILIAPVLRFDEAARIVTTFFELENLPNLSVKPPKMAWIPYQIEVGIFFFGLAAILVFGFNLNPLWFGIAILGMILAWIRFKFAGLGIEQKIIRNRSVFINENQNFTPISTIQDVVVHQAPWQKWSSRADLYFTVKVGTVQQAYHVDHLNANDVEQTKNELMTKI